MKFLHICRNAAECFWVSPWSSTAPSYSPLGLEGYQFNLFHSVLNECQFRVSTIPLKAISLVLELMNTPVFGRVKDCVGERIPSPTSSSLKFKKGFSCQIQILQHSENWDTIIFLLSFPHFLSFSLLYQSLSCKSLHSFYFNYVWNIFW